MSTSESVRQLDDEQLLAIARFCRGNRNLETTQANSMGRRVEYFLGDEFVDLLTSEEFREAKLFDMDEDMSRSQAVLVGRRMLNTYFHNAELLNKDKSVDYDEIDKLQPVNNTEFEDDEEAYYVWMLKASSTKQKVYAGLMVGGAIAICMIKAWPLWMKIIVWWISLIMLISMLSLLVLRIFMAAIFWILGFRGLWLLPNVLNDDMDILDAFSPFIGYGTTAKEFRMQQKQARMRRSKKNADKNEPVADAATESHKKVEFDFGWMNVAVVLVAGMVLCNSLGLFMPDNIPEFITTKYDLFKQFPGLAPPDYNATEEKILQDARDAAAAAAEAAEIEANGGKPKSTSSDGVHIPGMGESEDLTDEEEEIKQSGVNTKVDGEEEAAELD
eukprot:CAMPEP_0175146660 /NCGR_PEP_ID=MMETSP0087-20121206/15504_1 /TAXON_ID=136419 /ORGANISM="Unknown Unknown, Strain D1" /LENGTH=386 /DNA_ID=CAMNT_0016431651 /DNA_START=11 /DNA_END=1171 /DNA_ORIENTATION=+